MEFELWIWDRRDRLPVIRACLERSLQVYPDNSDYLTALARVILRMEPLRDPRSPAFDQARDLLARSSAIRPESSQTELAFLLLYGRRMEFERAALAGSRALRLNPADRLIKAYAGAAYFVSGRRDEGRELMRASESGNYPLPPEIGSYLVLSAYSRSNFDEVIQRSNMLTRVSCFCVFAARAASFAEMGQTEAAQAELATLLKMSPDVASHFTERMALIGAGEVIAERMAAGLLKAGLRVK